MYSDIFVIKILNFNRSIVNESSKLFYNYSVSLVVERVPLY